VNEVGLVLRYRFRLGRVRQQEDAPVAEGGRNPRDGANLACIDGLDISGDHVQQPDEVLAGTSCLEVRRTAGNEKPPVVERDCRVRGGYGR